jgi:hypothetical protein
MVPLIRSAEMLWCMVDTLDSLGFDEFKVGFSLYLYLHLYLYLNRADSVSSDQKRSSAETSINREFERDETADRCRVELGREAALRESQFRNSICSSITVRIFESE